MPKTFNRARLHGRPSWILPHPCRLQRTTCAAKICYSVTYTYRFLLRDLSDAQVRDELSTMGLLGEKVEALLAAWSLEQYKHTRLPSMSDLEDFLLRGIITEDQYRALMHRHGYDANHINWFLEAMKQPTAAAPRQPTRTDLENWFKKNIITEGQWYDEMKKLRYGDAYISYYFAEIE